MKEKIKKYYIDLVKDRRKGALAALFSFFLLLFSFIYGFFVRLIASCYQSGLFKSHKPDCKVISVGNITWGGTGKTPLVESVARFLKQQGKNPAILIRGYGKDEVYMLRDKFKALPVLAGRDRVKSARYALKHYAADAIILDDGFQHWRIGRDLDIVLIDSRRPFGNRRLIPRGLLREPLSSLSRADVFVLTRTESAKQNIDSVKRELQKYNRNAPIFEAEHKPFFLRSLSSEERFELSAIKDQRVAVISGIAAPESLTESLKLSGAQVPLKFYFSDHYQYRKDDLQKVEKLCLRDRIEIVVTTEKDAPRLAALLKSQQWSFKVWALCIEFKLVKEEERFFSLLKNGRDIARPYSILILSDAKAGHLNQSKALAKIIQKRKLEKGRAPFQIASRHGNKEFGTGRESSEVDTKIAEVKFKNGFCRVLLAACSIFANPGCRNCLACLRFCLKKESFYRLMQLPADIIVSAGSSLSSVNLFLSYKNKARSVCMMKPSFLSLNRFDLVIAPEHDRIIEKYGRKDNVVLTRIAPNLIDQQYLQEQADILRSRIQDSGFRIQAKGPTIGVLIGGDTVKYRMTAEQIGRIISGLKDTARNLHCPILVTTSRRTSPAIEKLLKESLANFEQCGLLVIANEKNIPEAVGGILGLSDIIVVSGESISMVSEAVSAEKYVLTFIPEKKVRAQTKQDRFLEKLEKEGIVKVIQPDSLVTEIKKLWEERPEKVKIKDKEAIYQAVARIM